MEWRIRSPSRRGEILSGTPSILAHFEQPKWPPFWDPQFQPPVWSSASSLPLAGLDKGSILEFFELTSVWAETAHFQLPTPRGYWRGPIPGSKRSWDLLLGEHEERSSVGLGVPWAPGTRLWLGGPPSPIDRVSGFGLGRAWVVLEPRPCQPLGGSDLGWGYELGLSVSCPVMPLSQSSLNPMCTYPDVLLYIPLFPCFRVARILKRFVT